MKFRTSKLRIQKGKVYLARRPRGFDEPGVFKIIPEIFKRNGGLYGVRLKNYWESEILDGPVKRRSYGSGWFFCEEDFIEEVK